jgi:hypothetical protein
MNEIDVHNDGGQCFFPQDCDEIHHKEFTGFDNEPVGGWLSRNTP